MSVSPTLPNLQIKSKGVAVAAILLTLLFAALPFSVSASAASFDAFQAEGLQTQDVLLIGSQSLSEQYVLPNLSISVIPNPVGVGQATRIRGLIEPLPPTYDDRYSGLTLIITKPDGTVQTLGPFLSESGLLYVSYTPEQVGTYMLQLRYAGQLFSSRNVTYLPAQSLVGSLSVQSEPVPLKLLTVDDNGPADFSSIQAAVNAAAPGDIVFVRNGVYREPQVNIKKSLALLGEDKTATILDGNTGAVRLYIQNASNVVIHGFTIRNGCGLYSAFSKDVVITENVVSDSLQGIILIGSANHTISKNLFTNNTLALLISEGSHDNTVSENIFTSNNGDATLLDHVIKNSVLGNYVAKNGLATRFGYHVYGIRLSYSNSNIVFHNDVIGNFEQADGWMSFNNIWDNGYPSGGNFWSDYNGTDANSDGIGDVPYLIDANNTDRYPLISPFKSPTFVQTTAALSIQPSPLVIGQSVTITAEITPPPPTLNDRFNALILTIGLPDGPFYYRGPFMSDSTGHLSTEYIPTIIGNYSIQLNYTGQRFASRNVTYLATQSKIVTLSVQTQVTPTKWIVDDDLSADFHTIQEAINAASSGDTVFVRSGTYRENIIVNKSLSLIGENAYRTIIIGKTYGKTVTISTSKITITNFTIQGIGGTPFQPNNVVVSFVNQNSFGNNIYSNIITGDGYGIVLSGSQHNVDQNYVTSNGFSGIYLNGSSNNHITRNNVTGGKTGICIAWPSSNNILRNNIMTGENLNLHVISYDIPGFTNDIDTSNTINGRPVYYWIGKANQVVPHDAGAVALINCVNMTVQDLDISNNGQGVLLAYTTGSTVHRNRITKCDNGIRVQSSSNNKLDGNDIYANNFGVVLVTSTGNTVTNNTVSANSMQGISLILSSSGNQIHHNSLDNAKQAGADESANTWDNGYPSGGNYWSDYNGTDKNGDGIGDTPYVISGNNADRYPLMKTAIQSNINTSTATTQSNTTTSVASKEKMSTFQPEENESQYEETTPIDEEPTSIPEVGQQPSTQTDPQLSAASIPIALLLGVSTAIAFGGPLVLLRRKR